MWPSVDRARRWRWIRAASPWVRVGAGILRLRYDARWGRAPDDFDARYGVATRVVAPIGQMLRTIAHGGFGHQPTPPGRFRDVVAGLDVQFEETIFVDYGSGAGRAVLLASQLPFKQVIGVELSPALHARAEANVRAFPASARRAATVRLLCADAAAYDLPPDPAVLYFYNPFGTAVMRHVVARLEASLQRWPRSATVLLFYCFKDTRAVVEASRMLRVIAADRDVVVLRTRDAVGQAGGPERLVACPSP